MNFNSCNDSFGIIQLFSSSNAIEKNFEHFVYIMLYRFAVIFFSPQIPIIRSDLEAREKAEEEEKETIPVKTEQDGRR